MTDCKLNVLQHCGRDVKDTAGQYTDGQWRACLLVVITITAGEVLLTLSLFGTSLAKQRANTVQQLSPTLTLLTLSCRFPFSFHLFSSGCSPAGYPLSMVCLSLLLFLSSSPHLIIILSSSPLAPLLLFSLSLCTFLVIPRLECRLWC